MKKYVFLILMGLTSLAACKKSSSEEEPKGWYMKFKDDGVSVMYTTGYAIFSDAIDPSYIAAGYQDDEDVNSMRVGLYPGDSFSFNTIYTYPASNAYLYYTDASGDSYANYPDETLTVRINLKEETAEYFKGTFSGTLKNSSGKAKTITEGSFRLPKVR